RLEDRWFSLDHLQFDCLCFFIPGLLDFVKQDVNNIFSKYVYVISASVSG
uniref:Uncharacterized protein n=1 Tax=Aegilops tauschii subsp. strangulata TaxID=200361 RepID=A0A453Q1N7_AEGTS